MRHLMIAALLGGSVLASPALAQEDGLYGSLFGGPTIVGDESFDPEIGDSLFSLEGGLGGAVGSNLGYDYGKFTICKDYNQLSIIITCSYNNNLYNQIIVFEIFTLWACNLHS